MYSHETGDINKGMIESRKEKRSMELALNIPMLTAWEVSQGKLGECGVLKVK